MRPRGTIRNHKTRWVVTGNYCIYDTFVFNMSDAKTRLDDTVQPLLPPLNTVVGRFLEPIWEYFSYAGYGS